MRLIPLAGSALILAACAPAAPPVEVAFTAPAQNAVVTDTTVVVHLNATGLKIVPATGTKVAGEGHHHIFVDTDPTSDAAPIGKATGIYHLGSGADSLKLTLPPGKHRLISVPASGDHVPIKGARHDTLNIEVRPPAITPI